MRPLSLASPEAFTRARFVLTDMDETLTFEGRLPASAYAAMERLQDAGVGVIPVTAAPAGWCDQMARMWPVSGVIGENGGLFFRGDAADHGLRREFWHRDAEREEAARRLDAIRERVQRELSFARLADDQLYRETSLAFSQPEHPRQRAELVDALRAAGADTTVNNLWVLAWIGGYDKLAMSRRILKSAYDLDIDTQADAIVYCGDSTNDAPMFAHFSNTIGVSTIRRHLSEIPVPPRWVTEGPGGAGFVEAADAILAARRRA